MSDLATPLSAVVSEARGTSHYALRGHLRAIFDWTTIPMFHRRFQFMTLDVLVSLSMGCNAWPYRRIACTTKIVSSA